MQTGESDDRPMPDAQQPRSAGNGSSFVIDNFGVRRDEHGPFWPPGHGPLFAAPELRWTPPPGNGANEGAVEPLLLTPDGGDNNIF